MSEINSKIYKSASQTHTLINAIIELNTQCNWKCQHCYIPKHDNSGPSFENVINIFKQIRELGCFDLSLTGGEIFCREDIMDIIKVARDMYFNVTLLSNISLLNENKIKKLSQMHISLITCTIFSLDEAIHDKITGIPGSLRKALNNALLIKKYNIPLEIKTIIMKDNYSSYNELLSYCTTNGFHYKVDAEVFSRNDGDTTPQNYKLTQQQLDEIILDIDKLRDFKPHKHSRDEAICPVVNMCCSIDSKGNVYPCNKYFISIGNINNESMYNIWNSVKANELRVLKWKDLQECLECDKNEYCYRCPGVALLEDGDLLGKSSLSCEFAQARFNAYC
jgi:radical SAM protein with 4Fe4S-binding SPASM domain